MNDHTVFSAADADAVEARLKQHYGDVRLSSEDVSLVEDSVSEDRFLLSRIRVSGSVAVQTESPVMSAAPATGSYRWDVGAERGEAADTPFLIQPGPRISAELSDVEVDAVTFPVADLERTARITFADDRLRLRFDSSRPRSPGWGGVYRDALRFAVHNRRTLLDSDLIRSMVYRHLAACTLEAFALDGSTADRHASARARYDGFRRARIFIDDHASLPITVEDIAQAAGLSVHDLHDTFRANDLHGGNASDALQRVRLAAANRDLVTADPASTPAVREVALRWGLRPRRFSVLHRRHYGVDPQHVLDRPGGIA